MCAAGCLLAGLSTTSVAFPVQAKKSAEVVSPASTERGAEMIQQARAAAGGEAAFRSVTSLTASVQLRLHVNYISVSPSKVEERQTVLKGKIQVEFERPDKFRKRVSTATLAGEKLDYVEVVNGSRAWRNPPLTAVSTSKSRHVIDVNDFERSLNYQAQGARQQFGLYALVFLLQGLPGNELKFGDGEWTLTERGKEDLVRVTGPDGFHANLLLDRTTHMPVGLVRSVVATRPVPVVISGLFPYSGQWQQVVQRAMKERTAHMKPAWLMRVEYRFLDRRVVNGISLPHRITTTVDGVLAEEMIVSGFKINSRLNPHDFEQPANRKGGN